jgi:hypothetical protein
MTTKTHNRKGLFMKATMMAFLLAASASQAQTYTTQCFKKIDGSVICTIRSGMGSF